MAAIVNKVYWLNHLFLLDMEGGGYLFFYVQRPPNLHDYSATRLTVAT